MDSNTHSTPPSRTSPPPRRSERLAALTAAIDGLAAEDLNQLPDAALADQVLELGQRRDGLDGQGLRRLATVDAHGAAGAEDDLAIGSTAAWLRSRLRRGRPAASSAVRTARARFRSPLAGTGQALCAGAVSPEPARVLAEGTHHLPHQVTEDAEPVLVASARRLDPPGSARPSRLVVVADPTVLSSSGSGAMAAGAVVLATLRRPGRPRRAPGARGRPAGADGVGPAGPPG
jgi:hypothetical protein